MSRTISRIASSFSHHLRMIIGSVALGALVCGPHAPAMAEDAKIKSMSFSTKTPYKKNTIYVGSSTGAKWDTILPGEVEFWAAMQVDTKWPGYVQDAGIFLGGCVDRQCGENGSPLIFYKSVNRRDYNDAKNISFPTSKLRISGVLPAPTPYGDEILKQCNQQLQPDGATKPHAFDMPMVVAFTVNTRKSVGSPGPAEVGSAEDNAWGGGDETRHAQFLAHVECVAHSQRTADPDPDPHRNKVTVSDLELYLATVAAPDNSPRAPAGAQCKPIKVTTRIATDKAGPVTVKQWRQVNGGPITSETRQMVATPMGGGKFGDDWIKFESFTKTTTVQYKDEVVGGTFAPSTPWKSITVHCNGDFAAPTNNANPDSKPPRGRADPVDKSRRVEEKIRENGPGAGLKGDGMLRPFGGRLIALPPPVQQPGLGSTRPINPEANSGFGNRRIFLR